MKLEREAGEERPDGDHASPPRRSSSWARRLLSGTYNLLWDLNNLLLIPIFSIITVDLVALGLGISTSHLKALDPIHDIICGFFFSEWALGLALASDRRAYLRTPARIGDLISSIPFSLLFQSVRLIRVFRVLRLLRVVWRMRRIRGRIREVVYMAGLVAAMAVSGAFALRMTEPETVSSFEDAMWWSIVTMSTVGYGDIAPTTAAGRAVAMTLIFLGIATFGYAISVVTSLMTTSEDEEILAVLHRIESRLERVEARQRSAGPGAQPAPLSEIPEEGERNRPRDRSE